jgi:hypothetical protein
MSRRLAAIALCVLTAGAFASEPGSGVYAFDCADGEGPYRINIRSDGAAEVELGEIVYMDLSTSYSYYGVRTPEDLLVAVLFEPEGSPLPTAADAGARIEIWRDDCVTDGEVTYYALINGVAAERLSYCGELGTPGADAEMPFSTVDYDVIGYLTCQALGAGLPRACPFGLTIGEAGSVALTIQTPFEHERRLERAGDGFRDASGEPVSAQREGRTWMVTVGEEHYEVPDAALGGD